MVYLPHHSGRADGRSISHSLAVVKHFFLCKFYARISGMVFAWAFGNVSKYITKIEFCQHLKKFFFLLDSIRLIMVQLKYCHGFLAEATDRSWHEICIDIFGMVLALANAMPQQFLFMAELAQFLHGILWHSSGMGFAWVCRGGLSDIMSVGAVGWVFDKKKSPKLCRLGLPE